MNKRNQWLITELQTASDIGQVHWRSLVNRVTFRDNLTTATGPATAAFYVDDNLETWLFASRAVVEYAPLLRQKLLLHELFHAVQYENLVSFFAGEKQKAGAFHNEVCKQQSGFAVLYARNEVEAEAFAIYALINHYGRQVVEDLGLISTAQVYMRGLYYCWGRGVPTQFA